MVTAKENTRFEAISHLNGNVILSSLERITGRLALYFLSGKDRLENVGPVVHLAQLFLAHVEVIIMALISPTRVGREVAKSIIGNGFFEIPVDAPISVCESRSERPLPSATRWKDQPVYCVSDTYEPPSSPARRIMLATPHVDSHGQLGQRSEGSFCLDFRLNETVQRGLT